MPQVVDVVDYVNVIAFTLLGFIAFVSWRSRLDAVSFWAAATFATLAVVVLVGVLPLGDGTAEAVVDRLLVLTLLLYPLLLYRFMASIDLQDVRLTRIVTGVTAVLFAATIPLPGFPKAGEHWPAWFVVWVVAFLTVWTGSSLLVSVGLWRAGNGQPSVSRKRMRMLGFAASAITAALFVAAASGSQHSAAALVSGLLATISSAAFLLGVSPPEIVRVVWRREEQQQAQQVVAELIAAVEPQEVIARVLPAVARLVGARGIAILDQEGEVIGADGVSSDIASDYTADLEHGRAIRIELANGAFVVWLSPYAPFFGRDELAVLTTTGSLTSLALDRTRLFHEELIARLELERANELQANFVAVAAHELRTPITAMHGIIETLTHLGSRLKDEDRRELQTALRSQSLRSRDLVEQLLNLSHLDAKALVIEPQLIDVRAYVEQVVDTIAGKRGHEIAIDIAAELDVIVDPTAFDRIVSNLLLNALRHGEPPISIEAHRSESRFRLSVEDRGPGVAPDVVEALFERFARSAAARARGDGSGLGLAIARSYAQSHGGDVIYTSPDSGGARFELVLPIAAHRAEPNGARGDALRAPPAGLTHSRG